jgi:hypothetical protein
MPFKHGRSSELWLNEVDISTYFHDAAWNVKVETSEVSTFKATWKSFIAGQALSKLTAAGYYDSSEADQVRETLQEVVGQLTYLPAGGIAIGDMARLLNINSSSFQNRSGVKSPVGMTWTAEATAPVGLGEVLHVMQSEAPATVTGTGAPLNLGVSTTTGLVAHLHVTAMTGGDTHTFKLQDATTLGGAYTDIASGAFVNVTAVGSQRLIVPGTIRAFVKLVAVISTHAATYGCVAART